MNNLKTFLISLGAIALVVAGYNFTPISFFADTIPLGASVTTIQGSDTLSSSRTTINDNFAALNADKLEISDFAATTSMPNLAEVGTITSGTWNGSVIDVLYGGTGLATLSANQVLLGDGTNAIKPVVGLGTTGQFLTSNGAGVAPTWQSSSVALGDDYDWTGYHTFLTLFATEASSTYATTSELTITGDKLSVNGVGYSYPSSQGASSTVLANDGSGGLINTVIYQNYGFIASNNVQATANTEENTGATSYTTLKTGRFGGVGTVRVKVELKSSGANTCDAQITDGVYTYSIASGFINTTYATTTVDIDLNNIGVLNFQLKATSPATCYVQNLGLYYDIAQVDLTSLTN